MEVLKTYTIWVDSKYRNNGTNSNAEFSLEQGLSLSNPNNYFELEVVSADIPYSFRTLDNSINDLPYSLVVPQYSINVNGHLQIPVGNYTILTLLQALATVIDNAFLANGWPSNKHPTLTFTYDRTSSRATLGMTNIPNNDPMTLTLKWTQADLLAVFFGFDYQADTVLSFNFSAVITSTNFVSPNAVNVSPITALYLRSDTLAQTFDAQERLVENFFTVSNILAKVPISVQFNTWLLYATNGFKVRLRNDEINTFNLYWTGFSFDPVDFEGVNWRAQIVIREIQPAWVTAQLKAKVEAIQATSAEIAALSKKRETLTEEAQTQLKKMRMRMNQLTV